MKRLGKKARQKGKDNDRGKLSEREKEAKYILVKDCALVPVCVCASVHENEKERKKEKPRE